MLQLDLFFLIGLISRLTIIEVKSVTFVNDFLLLRTIVTWLYFISVQDHNEFVSLQLQSILLVQLETVLSHFEALADCVHLHE